MTPPLAEQTTPLRKQVAEEILPFHGAMTPAGTSSTAELARK
jgi:hypothetical protein